MPRPGVGNPGNSGGRPYSLENRKKAAKVKGLTLNYLLKVLQGKDEELKKQIVLKIATVCFPVEIGGEDGKPIKISFDYRLKDVATPRSSAKNIEKSGEV